MENPALKAAWRLTDSENGVLTKNCTPLSESIIDKFSILLTSNLGDYTHEKRFIYPQIVAKLRQTDVLIGQGKTVPELCNKLEISRQIYYC